MDSDMIILDVTENMDKTIENLNKRFATVRAGRANPSSLDGVNVEYYGSMTPLKQLATISVPEARLIVIQPWDMSILKELEKAILASDIGITPNNDGKVLRLAFPELNEERRKEIVKDIKKIAEEAKVSIRSLRREGLDEAKKEQKDGNITEDDLRNAETQIQKLTDKKIEKIDEILANKEKEIMSV